MKPKPMCKCGHHIQLHKAVLWWGKAKECFAAECYCKKFEAKEADAGRGMRLFG